MATLIGRMDANTNLETENGLTTFSDDMYQFEITDVDLIRANAKGDGIRTASLGDSPGDDTLNATPDHFYFSTLFGNISGNGFNEIESNSSQGGHDFAVLNGSMERDSIFSNLDLTRIESSFNNQFELVTRNYPQVTVKPGDNYDRGHGIANSTVSVYSTEAFTRMRNETQTVRIEGPERMLLNSNATGSDARIFGSDGVDTLIATPELIRFQTPSRWLRFDGFASTTTIGGEGEDRAEFTDSLNDDLFSASKGISWLRGDGFINQARDFESVQIHSRWGMIQRIWPAPRATTSFRLRLETLGFRPTSNRAQASGFATYNVWKTGEGFDIVNLSDSHGDDQLYLFSSRATLINNLYTVRFDGMDRLVARAVFGGTNTLFDSTDEQYQLILEGDWI